jgi:hypothetical protein
LINKSKHTLDIFPNNLDILGIDNGKHPWCLAS